MVNTPKIKLDIYNKRRQIEDEKGIFLSARGLAKVMKIKPTVLHDLLKNGKTPQIKTIETICKFTGKTVNDYIIEDNE
jgi:hypothetical protein